ncbi:MAG: cyclic nucleotide-binding protein [Spirochaetes bacterium]|nr:MAG: cyclic nucleotide-binding protein [Spirochaetota bacterium]
MSLIGVLSTDQMLNSIIKEEFDLKVKDSFILQFLEDESSAMEFLNFDLPEIVIINFSDQNFPVGRILENIQNDSWLHNFGMVGLYDSEKHDEDELLKEYKNTNVLAMIDNMRVRSHILKCVQIIDQNRQIIFQKDLSDKLVDKSSGSFLIENDVLAVSVYAGIAATMLAQRGYINQDTKMRLQLGLSELIINGVEHGNCGITFEEKSAYLERGKSILDLIEEKCKDPEIARKRVLLEWEIMEDGTKFVIKDEGEGFDVKKLKEDLEREGPLSLHGRGIKMAKHFASKLYYNSKGNKVTFIVKHDRQLPRKTPVGFSEEEVLLTKRGDIIFEQGESSDFLYYISSGQFSVFHNNRHVGVLSPEDIFMGEMSFLLNNRRSATVRAESDGKLIKISRKSFISVVRNYPHYGIFLSKLLARKLVRANLLNALIEEQVT